MSDRTEYRQSRVRRPSGACELLLVRHGESAPAVPGRPFDLVGGQGDPPLHPDGERQAEMVSKRLLAAGEDLAAIYVTNLRRTVQTAAPLLAALGTEPVVEADLREVHLGDWEGGEFRKRAAEGDPAVLRMFETQRWDALPGAENDDSFGRRVRDAVDRIAGRHPDQAVAVFTHGGVIGRICTEAVGGSGFAIAGPDNASISHLIVTPDRWILRRFNDTSHLYDRFTVDP